jgi:hypothetical protein
MAICEASRASMVRLMVLLPIVNSPWCSGEKMRVYVNYITVVS